MLFRSWVKNSFLRTLIYLENLKQLNIRLLIPLEGYWSTLIIERWLDNRITSDDKRKKEKEFSR